MYERVTCLWFDIVSHPRSNVISWNLFFPNYQQRNSSCFRLAWSWRKLQFSIFMAKHVNVFCCLCAIFYNYWSNEWAIVCLVLSCITHMFDFVLTWATSEFFHAWLYVLRDLRLKQAHFVRIRLNLSRNGGESIVLSYLHESNRISFLFTTNLFPEHLASMIFVTQVLERTALGY